MTDDVITSFEGQVVRSPATLNDLLLGSHVGDTVVIGWTDPKDQPHTAKVQLGSTAP